jgi:phage terminase small subunit
MFHYKYLSTTYCNSFSITRKKDVAIPKHGKTIYEKKTSI